MLTRAGEDARRGLLPPSISSAFRGDHLVGLFRVDASAGKRRTELGRETERNYEEKGRGFAAASNRWQVARGRAPHEFPG